MSCDDLYAYLLDEVVVIRDRSDRYESGFSATYLPTAAMLRTLYPDTNVAIAAKQFQDEVIQLLNAQGPPSMMPANNRPEELIGPISRLLEQTGRQTLFFEGYTEQIVQSPTCWDAIARHFQQQGIAVLGATVDAVNCWNNKPYFRTRVADIIGAGALVPGTCFARQQRNQLVRHLTAEFERGISQLIVKVSSAGGWGNLILRPSQWTADPAQLDAFLSQSSSAKGDWILVEHWRPWSATYCVSFFIDGRGKTLPVEVCEQLLTRQSGGCIGSKSFLALSMKDKQVMVDFCCLLVEAMAIDGVRGFIGIDTIVCEPLPGDTHYLPDSGQTAIAIEANIRINSHNQDCWFLAHLARREGLHRRDFIHMAIKVSLPLTIACRQDAIALFSHQLEGLALPLSANSLTAKNVYFFLSECYGGGCYPSRYNRIILLGFANPIAQHRILACTATLAQAGLLPEGLTL